MSDPIKLVVVISAVAVAATWFASNQVKAVKRQETAAVAEPQRPARHESATRRPATTPTRAVGYGRIEIAPDAAGHYNASVSIEGRTLSMLVDTGATFVSLSFEDAERIGVFPMPSDWVVPVMTASGTLKGARATLRHVSIGTISASDVPALVLPRGATNVSLLGMSFLRKLGGFEVANGNLVLRP